MQIIKEQKTGEYYSSAVDISKDEWLEILKDESVSEKYKEAVICFYYMPEYKGSCVAVGNRLGKNAYSLVATIMNFGKYVQKRLGRFQVVDEDGNNTYWPIPMMQGKALSNKEEGNFEWTLRPELADAIREYLYWYLIERYKELRREIQIRQEGYDELYKWELITSSVGKSPLNIVTDGVVYSTNATKGGFMNLIDAVRDNKTLKYLVNSKQEDLENALNDLVGEGKPLHDRLAGFKTSMSALLPQDGYKSKANDERTAATILTCYNPDKYTFYKYEGMYDNLCRYLGEEKKPTGLCYEHYLNLIRPLAEIAVEDTELQSLVSPMLEGQYKSDLLLAQDMVWMLLCKIHERLGYIGFLVWSVKRRIWLWSGDQETAKQAVLCCGSSAKTIKDFRPFKSKNALLKAYQEDVGNKDTNIPTAYWNFVHEAKPDDVVVVFKSKTEGGKRFHLLYGWGKFTSDCIIDETNADPMCRNVEWHQPFLDVPIEDKAFGNSVFFHGTTDKQAQHIFELLNIENDSISETMKTKLQSYIDLLKANHNLILTGAPGTGKTFLAKAIAEEMDAEVGFVQFHPSYDYTDFVEGLRPKNDDNGNVGFERRDGVFKEFCKRALKASFVNTVDNFDSVWNQLIKTLEENDFIEIPLISGKYAMRIELNEDGDGLANRTYDNDKYERGKWIRGQSKFFSKEQCYNVYRGLNGVPSGGHDTYRKAVVRYMKDKMGLLDYKVGNENTLRSKPFVFIIDEINRGEISKIFGELFFSIDPGYRGEKGMVQTQYQNMIEEGDAFKKGFFVPENVYIIGTMNDIDRSVESMDFAMRRRFAWKEVTAEESYEAMKDKMVHAEEVKTRMTALNNAICDEKLGLNKSYQIGAAYFLKLDEYDGDFDKLWEYHLRGLLSEYLRGNRDAEKQLEQLKKAYDGNTESQNE